MILVLDGKNNNNEEILAKSEFDFLVGTYTY